MGATRPFLNTGIELAERLADGHLHWQPDVEQENPQECLHAFMTALCELGGIEEADQQWRSKFLRGPRRQTIVGSAVRGANHS